MTKEAVIEKIKSLLALASDPSTTEHERTLAFNRARTLIDRFMVSEQDITPDKPLEIVWVPFNFLVSRACEKYLPFYAHSVALYFGCFVCRRVGTWHFVGFKSNIEVATYAVEVLTHQGKIDFRTAFRNRLNSRENLITFEESFWYGFVQALQRRFTLQEIPDEKGLTVYDPVKQLYDSLTTVSLGNTYGAAAEGFTSGINAQLHRPIETTTKGNLLK